MVLLQAEAAGAVLLLTYCRSVSQLGSSAPYLLMLGHRPRGQQLLKRNTFNGRSARECLGLELACCHFYLHAIDQSESHHQAQSQRVGKPTLSMVGNDKDTEKSEELGSTI